MNSGILLAAACFLVPVAAAAEKLNVKPGLWEINSTSRISGVPPLPPEVLAKMTPEQRAQMEAAFKAETQKGPQRDVDRECITLEELERPFQSANAENCTQTIVATTRTTQEVRLVCTGEYKGSGVFRVTTPTAETMTGTLDLSMGEAKNAMRIQAKLDGRWLGADCGDEAEAEENAGSDEDDLDDSDFDEGGEEPE